MLTITISDIWPNPQRKLQLRNGWPVRIYTASHEGECDNCVSGAYRNERDGKWYLASWKDSGAFRWCGEPFELDIVESPPALVTYQFEAKESAELICFRWIGKCCPQKGDWITWSKQEFHQAMGNECGTFDRYEKIKVTPIEAKRVE